jgi:hypothetical protein
MPTICERAKVPYGESINRELFDLIFYYWCIGLSHFENELKEIHIQSLEGLGASYRIKGFFKLDMNGSQSKVNFKGVAFGGHYGGHNVNIEISSTAMKNLEKIFKSKQQIDDLLSEVQRRILNGEMIVEFDRLKQGPNADPFGNISS